eukprot:9362437-Karenia_brevis.AAC.1
MTVQRSSPSSRTRFQSSKITAWLWQHCASLGARQRRGSRHQSSALRPEVELRLRMSPYRQKLIQLCATASCD